MKNYDTINKNNYYLCIVKTKQRRFRMTKNKNSINGKTTTTTTTI